MGLSLGGNSTLSLNNAVFHQENHSVNQKSVHRLEVGKGDSYLLQTYMWHRRCFNESWLHVDQATYKEISLS